jgi:hypothetical protein
MEIVAMSQGKLTSISASVVIFVALPLVTLTTIRRGLGFSLQNILLAFMQQWSVVTDESNYNIRGTG